MFRREVTEARAYRILGKVTLIQPISIYLITFTIASIFIVLFIYASMASYSRKETVKGYLTPKAGIVKVFSNKSGVVDTLYIKEGDLVKQGDALLKIRHNQNLSTGAELSAELTNELLNQIHTLQQEYDATIILSDNEALRLVHQDSALKRQIDTINEAKSINKRKLNLKNEKILKNKQLLQKGYISANQFNAVEEEQLEVLSEGNRLDRELAIINTEISMLKSEIKAHPEQLLVKQSLIQRKISELKSQMTEISEQFEFVRTAPEAGIVTAIQPTVGDSVDSNTPLLSIIPVNSPLEIELLLPTRSAGFVKLGDIVNIRFDAFPYQKFGFLYGEVINIDKTVVLPSDRVLPIEINEAMYRVRAKINLQFIQAYGKSLPLKIGMLADADIILESRSLLEWLLDPIYAVKGRL
jgi:membrane fusion protein